MVSFNTSASALPEHAVHSYCLRWDKADVLSYFNRSYDLLSNIDVTCLDNGPAGIEYCYQAIVTIVYTWRRLIQSLTRGNHTINFGGILS